MPFAPLVKRLGEATVAQALQLAVTPSPGRGWQHAAACRPAVSPYPTAVFFTADGQEEAASWKALAVCRSCPVVASCLAAALREEGSAQARNRFGIRGGTLPGERGSLYRTELRKAS